MTRWAFICWGWTLLLGSVPMFAQHHPAYTRYLTGDSSDVATIPLGGIGLLGGAAESDEGMRWWLEKAQGGDIVVLRASGGDGYHEYFYHTLGVQIHSVETFVCKGRNASYDPYLLQRLSEAEAVWIAGGDQWNYYSFWKNTPLDSLLQRLFSEKHIAIGGTSAGMAILAGIIFTAEKGTTTSPIALGNPFDSTVCLSTAPLLEIPLLHAVITDTHYDARERNGRHVVFLARARYGLGIPVFGIACEESTMVGIEPDGKARVFGQYPRQPHYAYFLQSKMSSAPEQLQAHHPLEWWDQGDAVYTYRVPGTQDGQNYFSLSDWKQGHGGRWEKWAVRRSLLERDTLNIMPPGWENVRLANSNDWFRVHNTTNDEKLLHWESSRALQNLLLQVIDVKRKVPVYQYRLHGKSGKIGLPSLQKGWYQLILHCPSPQEAGSFQATR